MSIPLQIHIATRDTWFYKFKTVRTTKISWTAFPLAPYSVDLLDGFYFAKYLQIYHWARLLVCEFVRSIGGTRFAYEDMHMHQAFYVQDLGCNTINTTCKNAWKVSHTLDVDLSCFHSICKGILSGDALGPIASVSFSCVLAIFQMSCGVRRAF